MAEPGLQPQLPFPNLDLILRSWDRRVWLSQWPARLLPLETRPRQPPAMRSESGSISRISPSKLREHFCRRLPRVGDFSPMSVALEPSFILLRLLPLLLCKPPPAHHLQCRSPVATRPGGSERWQCLLARVITCTLLLIWVIPIFLMKNKQSGCCASFTGEETGSETSSTFSHVTQLVTRKAGI